MRTGAEGGSGPGRKQAHRGLGQEDRRHHQRWRDQEVGGAQGNERIDRPQHADLSNDKKWLTIDKFAPTMRGMTDQLLGVAEIAAMLGLTRQRVNQIVQTEGFPPPRPSCRRGGSGRERRWRPGWRPTPAG